MTLRRSRRREEADRALGGADRRLTSAATGFRHPGCVSRYWAWWVPKHLGQRQRRAFIPAWGNAPGITSPTGRRAPTARFIPVAGLGGDDSEGLVEGKWNGLSALAGWAIRYLGRCPRLVSNGPLALTKNPQPRDLTLRFMATMRLRDRR